MRWLLPQVTQDQAAALAAALQRHPLPARILVHRGYQTPEAAHAFLADGLADLPDPFRMKGMAAAVERLTRALRTGEKITLYGDYDVDGVCSTTLMTLFLRELGASPATYIPHRLGEGYGLLAGGEEAVVAQPLAQAHAEVEGHAGGAQRLGGVLTAGLVRVEHRHRRGSVGGTVWWSTTTTSRPSSFARVISATEVMPQSSVTSTRVPSAAMLSTAARLRP